MAQQELAAPVRARAVAALGPKARKDYQKFRPLMLQPSHVDSTGRPGHCVIVEGVPRFLHDKTEFTGMMMIPISTGQVTTFMMIPLYDHFDVYEVFNDQRMRRPYCVLATTRGVKFSAGNPVRFAGVLRKMEAKKEAERQHSFYMEVCYYTHLRRTRQISCAASPIEYFLRSSHIDAMFNP